MVRYTLLSELTWFTKGLRLAFFPLLIYVRPHESELTWFTKGLRLIFYNSLRNLLISVRIDLIYEGIATVLAYFLLIYVKLHGPNWPDLRRDCDLCLFFQRPPLWNVRIDLIYEGIATCSCGIIHLTYTPSELTWFTKGLRLFKATFFMLFLNLFCPNWPDLRRDCDFSSWF